MTRVVRTGIAGLISSLVLAAPAAAATVTVRVEGATSTLVPETRVTTSAATVVDKSAEGGTTCDGLSGGGAVELATGGNWGGDDDSGFGQELERIGSEAYPIGTGDAFSNVYWSLYVNNVPAAEGLCQYVPQEGDEILVAAFCGGPATTPCFDADPLDARGAATVAPGAPYGVTVDEHTAPFGQPATTAPSAGATVTGGGQTATTAADGTAALTFTERGPVTLTVTKGGRVRDQVAVCVTDGSDGFCGTDVPAPPCEHLGEDGRCGTADRLRPEARVVGIEHHQTFRRKAAPRELQASVSPDVSGVRSVAFSLLRKVGRKCTAFDGARERFVRARCGTHPSFVVGDRADVSYLLPKRLGKGRYVLHVTATDRAGNVDIVEPGRSRVVFFVR